MNVFTGLRLFLKRKFDHIRNKKLKEKILNAFPFWLGALISGIVAVLYAKLFGWAEIGTHFLFKHFHWSFLLFTPACFIIAWMLVYRYAPFARGSGIPQVAAAIELTNPKHNYKVNALLSLRIIGIKIISSLIMVFGGGVVGREGPTIQISASIFKKINDLLPAWYPRISKRNMIVTGAAAGLASAFNTPLGGIVFAIEELTKTHFSFFRSALLTGVIIAGLTALSLLGPYLYLGYPQVGKINPSMVFAIIPLAVVTALAGMVMISLILFIFKSKKKFTSNYQRVIFVSLCGFIVAALALFITPDMFGSGKEIMVRTLFTDDKHVAWYMPVLRIIGPVCSFSAGAAGGVFAPSLTAGASIGALFAGWFHLTGPETNLLILCGMTGFLTTITRSPFTSSILVLEMTDSHNVIFYIMLTALVSNLVAGFINRHSFYDQMKVFFIHEIHVKEQQENNDQKELVPVV